MHPKTKVVILASGSGTTAETFVNASLHGEVEADVLAVISNHKKAGVFERIQTINNQSSANIQCVHIGKGNYPAVGNEIVGHGRQTAAEERAILEILNQLDADLVLLLGYMKLVGPSIVRQFGWQKTYSSVYQARMLNTHPGLLPETKGMFGLHVQEYVIKNNLKAGHCIFAVDEEYDDGPVIAEHLVEVKSDDTADSLFERVKQSEKSFLAADIQNFLFKQKNYFDLQ